MLDLNLFNNRNVNHSTNDNDDFLKTFIGELKNLIDEENKMDKENNILNKSNSNDLSEEYNLYEKKKIFLDNISRNENDLAWIMDDQSVCISEHGEGGPYSISEINLPNDAMVGKVYEKIDGKYVYNKEITEELNNIS